MLETTHRARSEKDITRVSGTLGPSSILGGRTTLNFLENLTNSDTASYFESAASLFTPATICFGVKVGPEGNFRDSRRLRN